LFSESRCALSQLAPSILPERTGAENPDTPLDRVLLREFALVGRFLLGAVIEVLAMQPQH
jgi:hypothetical protein